MKLITILLIITTFSCGHKIKNFELYQEIPLPKTSFMPSSSEVLNKNLPKVVLFISDQSKEKASLAKFALSHLSNFINSNKLAKVIERKLSKNLKNEIILAELNDIEVDNDLSTDYSIMLELNNLNFTKKFIPGYSFMSKKGAYVNILPKNKYQSTIDGEIRFYKTPSTIIEKSLKFSSKSSKSITKIQDGGSFTESENATKDKLNRDSVQAALDSISHDIRNFFAKKGYIMEKRMLDKKIIYKISLGKNDGIKMNDEIEIWGKYNIKNNLTGTLEQESILIAKAFIADKISDQNSWIVIDKYFSKKPIRMGDIVKIKHGKSFDVKFSESISTLSNLYQ